MWTVQCARCRQTATYHPNRWHCPCGGPWEPPRPLPFDHRAIRPRQPGIWRYAELWPFQRDPITMGEGWTPLIPLSSIEPRLWAKLDYIMPTGSYKDRGTATGLSALQEMGAHHVMDDSSGNAGASLAAYAARAGLPTTLFVPAHASPVKKAQMRTMGARLVEVPGPRAQATAALMRALEQGGTYASHVYNPFTLLGLAATAWEIWEQLGRAPDAVITPLGHGMLFLGLFLGFEALQAAGYIDRLPRLYGVQAAACAPLAQAFAADLETPAPVEEGETIAEGVRIATPPRGPEILQAARITGGAILSVPESEIQIARESLARHGLFVEPTGALAMTIWTQVLRETDRTVVLMLTGSGLKSPS
ncbi:pyridoxal-phosphate dependent enzyme [Thermoflexus sp.]|uniref:pyridoxal-phosphate dependent enzyme n=1 Tax=Thermoflexus sp. TaxID=1969742 RepID=UPI001766B62F|nr:pyridoxal-phosphate dependent enzyme [Thermoflexus sp.]